MSTKSNSFTILESFIIMAKRQFNTKIKIVRSDIYLELGRGLSHSELFSSHGILHQTTCPYTPQQNGVVERKHKNLLESCRALLFNHIFLLDIGKNIYSLLPIQLIGFLLESLVLKLPMRFCLGKLLHILISNPLDVCVQYIHTLTVETNCNLEQNFAFFIGYPFGKKRYKVLNLKTKQISISRNVIFHEHIYPFSPQKQDNFIVLPTTQNSTIDQSIPISHQVPISSASPSAKSHVSSRSPTITTIPNSSSSSPGYISQPLIPDSTHENMFPFDSSRDDSSLIQELRRS